VASRRQVLIDMAFAFATVIAGSLAMWAWTGDPVTGVTFELGVITGSFIANAFARRWSR
jgi:hypothetical protein